MKTTAMFLFIMFSGLTALHAEDLGNSPFSPDSLNNPFGAGNPFKADSPNNPYGQGWRIEGR